ncbi:MAG: hypothetical protein ACI4M4_08170 [Candidatus Ornithospirochaeta sp.]
MSDLFLPLKVVSSLSPVKAKRNVEESKAFLLNDFSSMGKILSSYSPLEMMKMARWEERRVLALGGKDIVKKKSAVLLPILLQSIVESNAFRPVSSSVEIKLKDWDRIKTLSEDVVRRIARWIDSKVSIAIGEGKVTAEDAIGLRAAIEERLLPSVMDEKTLERESWLLRALLEEVPDFQGRFGIDSPSFALNIKNIAKVGLNGIDNLVRDVAVYSQEYSLSEAQLRARGELEGLDESEIFNLITKRNHWEGRAKELSNLRDGYSLFMPSYASSLPFSTYGFYSMKAGQLDLMSFLEKGFWPALRYPFIELEGKHYSFVAMHLPLFLSYFTSVDRILASSRNVLSIFHLSDCDTYVYDGNKIEISVLPSVRDTNPILYPSSFSRVVKKRKDELSLQRKLGHKRLIVDPDMVLDMEKKDETVYVSSSFLYRCTVDKSAKTELLTALLGYLELPGSGKEYSMDTEEDLYSTESSTDDLRDDPTTDEYEYDNIDEDEESRLLDERDANIQFVEYDRKEASKEEKESMIERYSLTEDLIKKSEEEEEREFVLDEALDDDIFDDSEEDEKLDDIGPGVSYDSEFFDAADASDEYEVHEEEEEKEESGQLDFLSLLDEEDPEEAEFENELDEEEKKSFQEEELHEAVLDSIITLPSENAPSAEDDILSSVDEEIESPSPEMEEEGEIGVEIEGEEPNDAVESSSTPEDLLGEMELPTVSEEETTQEMDEESPSLESIVDTDLPSFSHEDEVTSDETQGGETEEDPEEDQKETMDGEEFSDASEKEDAIKKDRDVTPKMEEESPSLESIVDTDLPSFSHEDEVTTKETQSGEAEEDPEEDQEETMDREDVSDPSEEAETEMERESEKSSPLSEEPPAFFESEETKAEEGSEKENESSIHDVDSTEESMGPEVFAPECEEDSSLNGELPLEKEHPVVAEEDKEEEPSLQDENAVAEEEGNVFMMEDSPSPLPEELYREEEPQSQEKEEEKGESVPEEPKNSETDSNKSFCDSLFSALGLEDMEEDETLPEVTEPEEEKEEEAIVLEDKSPLEIESVEEEEVDDEIEEKAEGIVYSIYKELGKDSAFASFIRSSDSGTLEELEEIIQSCWNRQQVEGKDKLFNIVDYSLSILLAHDSIRDDLRLSELLNNAGGVMYSRDMDTWKAVIVYINSSYTVEEAMEKTISRETFSASDWKRVTYIGEQMRKR